MEDKELYWLAGILEGEGSFLKNPPSGKNAISIALQMTDEDIVAKVAALFEVSYFKCNPRKSHHKISYKLSVSHSKAQTWMIKLKPLMGQRRQQQIENALATFIPYKKAFVMPSKEVLEEMHKTMSLRKIAKIIGCRGQTVLNHIK